MGIFISEECTERALSENTICEGFETSKQLFHYLRWSIKMQQIDEFYKVFNLHSNREQNVIIVFNTELHRNTVSNLDGPILSTLYIVGVQNDKITVKSPRWKMKQFMTSSELYKTYGIKHKYLPIGSRANSPSFKQFMKQKEKRFIIISGFIRFNYNRYAITQSLRNFIVLSVYTYYDPFKSNQKNKYSAIHNIPKDVYCKL